MNAFFNVLWPFYLMCYIGIISYYEEHHLGQYVMLLKIIIRKLLIFKFSDKVIKVHFFKVIIFKFLLFVILDWIIVLLFIQLASTTNTIFQLFILLFYYN